MYLTHVTSWNVHTYARYSLDVGLTRPRFGLDDAYKLYTFARVLYTRCVERVKIIKILFSVKNSIFVRIIRVRD